MATSPPTLDHGHGTIRPRLRAIARGVLDSLFPWSCAGCEAPAASALCGPCLGRIRWITGPLCPACGLPLASPPSHLCGACRADPPPFRRLRALAAYRPADEERDPLGIALRGLKYARRRALAAPLSELLAARFLLEDAVYDRIAPVPLHLSRLRSRGFNQAALLARAPARQLRVPLDAGLLVRSRDTPSQVGLGEEERTRNVRRAFALRPGRTVEGERILLVDDVATSTATVRACAEVLRRAGAAWVDVLVLARALVR